MKALSNEKTINLINILNALRGEEEYVYKDLKEFLVECLDQEIYDKDGIDLDLLEETINDYLVEDIVE